MVEGATIFAQNAKAGGVNVTVKNVDGGTIYGDQYLKWPFSADYWGTRNYLLQAATGVLKTAPFNERRPLATSHLVPTSTLVDSCGFTFGLF